MDGRWTRDQDRLYEYLLDSGVLNDVHTLAESAVSTASSTGLLRADDGADDGDEDARQIADRLLDRNADDFERALDAVVRNARLAVEHQLVDFRWPQLTELTGPGRPAAVRKTLRNLNALVRLPFTCDTYATAYFRKLTKGLEHAMSVDAFFELTARVYAKLVHAAPDFESAAESFMSLCEATHLRYQRRRVKSTEVGGKSVAAVCLLARCLSVVCKRGAAAGSKHVKPSVIEFVATVAGCGAHDNGDTPYAALCRAQPTAEWFDHVAKYGCSRSAYFACLDGDRKLLKAVVSSLVGWMAEPQVPGRGDGGGHDAAVVRYACAVHAAHLLAKMFRYRAAWTLFPVKLSKSVGRVHAVGVADYCLQFLSANRDAGVPATLARGLRDLVCAVIAFRPEVIDAVADDGHAQCAHRLRILADSVRRHAVALDYLAGRERLVDELFRKRRRRRDDDGGMESLVRVAAALSARHEHVWQLVTRRMAFLEAAVAGRHPCRSLMVNVRCTPLAAITYHLEEHGGTLDDDDEDDDRIDWSDPRQKLMLTVACATEPGRHWLDRTGALCSLNDFLQDHLDRAETALEEPDVCKSLDSIVDMAYSFCGSFEGLQMLLDDGVGTETEKVKLTELYYISHKHFDGHSIARDVLVMLWLRLIETATHTFSLRVYADLKLKYQDTLTKLYDENRAEDVDVIIVDETTELLTRLRSPPPSACGDRGTASDRNGLSEFLAATDCRSDVWLPKARATVIRCDRISGPEMVDLIVSFGRRRFEGQLDLSTFDRRSTDLTEFEATGIRLALRYGSSVGIVAEDSASELERLYGGVERLQRSGLFDCMTCTLFMASQGSENKCIEACAVLLKLGETTRFVWPPAFDGHDADRTAAFGHLVEGLLQQEQPEVHNAFKMSGVSWWLLCSGWASDCFWGRLRWSEICRWMCLPVLFSVDYQAFFFTCLAAARKRQWLEAFNQGRFCEVVHRSDFGDFRLVDHADYLEKLAKKYQRSISKKLVSEFDAC
uniref:Protein broad-minded n=1 Tax=Sipha flava TaxID=143950 RepID=A0A2S2QY77_9HEMI